MTYHVTSNHHVRELVPFFNLPSKVQADFDYVTGDERYDTRFVKYRGEWYDTGDVEMAPDAVRALGWDSWQTESFWSAKVFCFFDKEGYLVDGVIVGDLYSQA